MSFPLLVPIADAQTGAATNAPSEAARCEKILPLKTLNSEAGAGFKTEFACDRDPGEIECGWTRLEADGNKTLLIVMYRDKQGIAGRAKRFQQGRTVEEMWEVDVRETEVSQESKRQTVASLGKLAAVVPLPKTRLGARTFVLRENDWLMLTTSGLSTAEITKVAKSLAAP